MWYCPECGYKNKDWEEYCCHCGAKDSLGGAPASYPGNFSVPAAPGSYSFCKNCGAKVRDNSFSFCAVCGYKLSGQNEERPVIYPVYASPGKLGRNKKR